MQSEIAAHHSTVDDRVAAGEATFRNGVKARTIGHWRTFLFGGPDSAVSSPYHRLATGEASLHR